MKNKKIKARKRTEKRKTIDGNQGNIIKKIKKPR